jgi:hypothetical protein
MPRRNNFRLYNFGAAMAFVSAGQGYKDGEAGCPRGQVHAAITTRGMASAIHDRPHQMPL